MVAPQSDYEARIRRRAHDRPTWFTRNFLSRAGSGGERLRLWSKQVAIQSLVAQHDRVAVRSGHKIGKSTVAVATALWWFCTRPRGRVVMTSASFRQVRDILWKELRRIIRDHATAELGFGARIAEDPETGIRMPDGREIVGVSTNEPDRMGGYSGPEMLFILDEASGIPEPIFEAIEGNRAGRAKLVMFGNPLRTSGTFFDAFHNKSAFWKTMHISSRTTPNVLAGRTIIPGLAEKSWVDEKLAEWREDSALFQVRVEGNFPSHGSNAVIALFLCHAAVERWADTPITGPLHIGVDVAYYGDDSSVIQPRRGKKALAKVIVSKMDPVEVAEEVWKLARILRDPGEKPVIKVDVIGIGAGVAAILKRNKDLDVREVNVAESATADGYSKLRDQLWFGVTDWLKDGGAYEADEKLDQELVAPIYTFDAQGRRKVSSKDDIKALLPDHRSPDRADALALSVYDAPKKVRPGVLI